MADTREKLNCLTVKHQHEADNLSDAARKACGDDGTVSTFKWMHSLAAAHKEFVSELDDIACLLENGVTVQEWIPVTERLPKGTDGHVLVTDGDKVKISCRNAMYQTRGGETWCAQNYGAGMCVTHWMPLPQPPKEG